MTTTPRRTNNANTPRSLEAFSFAGIDFLDLGAGSGASTSRAMKRFGARRGLGVDSSPAKVEQARAAGLDVVVGDATSLGLSKQVRFTTMMDFLEHLPDLAAVEKTIASAAEASTDFLYIFHPSFEGEEYLAQLGLRQYWWYWAGHKTHIHIEDYCRIFDRLGLRQYIVRYLTPIADSQHPSILTRFELPDQHRFDPKIHRERPRVVFERPVWRAQEIFVELRALEPEAWTQITAPVDLPAIY